MFSSLSSQCNVVSIPKSFLQGYLYYALSSVCTCVSLHNNNVMQRPEKQEATCNASNIGLGVEKRRQRSNVR